MRSTICSSLSGLGFTPDSNHSSEAFESVADIEEEISVAGAEMSTPSDPAAAAEATRLSEIRGKVEYKVSRLNADRNTAGHVDAAKQKLSDILNLAEEYGVGITALPVQA